MDNSDAACGASLQRWRGGRSDVAEGAARRGDTGNACMHTCRVDNALSKPASRDDTSESVESVRSKSVMVLA